MKETRQTSVSESHWSLSTDGMWPMKINQRRWRKRRLRRPLITVHEHNTPFNTHSSAEQGGGEIQKVSNYWHYCVHKHTPPPHSEKNKKTGGQPHTHTHNHTHTHVRTQDLQRPWVNTDICNQSLLLHQQTKDADEGCYVRFSRPQRLITRALTITILPPLFLHHTTVMAAPYEWLKPLTVLHYSWHAWHGRKHPPSTPWTLRTDHLQQLQMFSLRLDSMTLLDWAEHATIDMFDPF